MMVEGLKSVLITEDFRTFRRFSKVFEAAGCQIEEVILWRHAPNV